MKRHSESTPEERMEEELVCFLRDIARCAEDVEAIVERLMNELVVSVIGDDSTRGSE